MSKGYEIERKFLVEFPDISRLNVIKRLEIVQTYLESGENNVQRRVRRLCVDDEVKYIYTEKVFITPVTREETEYEISEAEYSSLLEQARRDTAPVNKVRCCFEYDDQHFELDIYPFSDRLAVLELELESAEQEIRFPETVKVIKEVTADGRYANAALASAGAFPE